MEIDYYDKQGEPITSMQWGKLLGDDEYRRVGLDKLPDGGTLSTVWLGLDHNFSDDGPPIIFESMIFGGEHDEYQERYSTLEEAIEGHRKILQQYGTEVIQEKGE